MEPVHTSPDAVDENAVPDQLIIVVGRGRKRRIYMSPYAAAALFEMSRFGISVFLNSNHRERPREYTKMSFGSTAPGDFVNIRRILFGASEYEETKALWRPDDYDPENTYGQPYDRDMKDSRAVALRHVADFARRREEAGNFPVEFTRTEYEENLRLLFAWLDGWKRLSNYHPSDPRHDAAPAARRA